MSRLQVPAALVLAVVAAGLVVVTVSHWQSGGVVVALGLLLGAGLRLTLPAGAAGWLVVRGRLVDALVLLAMGFGVLVLSLTIPPG